jgi:hypothetical protein
VKKYEMKDVIFLQDGEVTSFDIHAPKELIPPMKWVQYPSGKYFLDEDFDSPPELIPTGPTMYRFDIRIISTGEVRTRHQEFDAYKKDDQLYILFEISNGQIMALPYRPEKDENFSS